MSGSICDVLPRAAALLGAGDAPVAHEPVRRVAIVLVDGMGHDLLARMAPHAPLLAELLAGGVGELERLGSTFPSTTPTSLVSLGTGVRPGEHGVLGFTVARPGTEDLLTHIAWRDDPDPADWQPVPTWFEQLAARGVPSTTVLPAAFAGSGLTAAAYRGSRFQAVADGEDAVAALLESLRAGPGLVFGYTPDLDAAGHLHGIDSDQWRSAATAVDAYLQRIVDGLPADAALLVTADHGMLDVDDRIDLRDEPALRDGLRLATGEPRVRYLHARPGASDDVLAAWTSVLGDRADVVVRDEAIARGWFGPVPDRHRERIGDVVVACTGTAAVFGGDGEPDEVRTLVGLHGGRTPVETGIPLISVSGS